MSDTVGAYDAQAVTLAARFESVSADIVHAALLELFRAAAT